MKIINVACPDNIIKHALVDESDYDRLAKYAWYEYGDRPHANIHYRSAQWRGTIRPTAMHTFLMPVQKGSVVDHRNRNPYDNRRSNLRRCTYSENTMNSRTRSDNTSGHRGVQWDKRKKRWAVLLSIHGTRHRFGSYATFDEAVAKYRAEATKAYPDFVNYS